MAVEPQQPGTGKPSGNLRTVQPAELHVIHSIERASFPNPWPLHIFQQEMANSWSRLWGWYPRGVKDPIAFLLFWLVYDEVHILNIATHPSWRRAGIASILLDALIDESRGAGARYLTLEVRPSNTPAIRLYEEFWFETVGVRPRYYSDNGEDALVMVRKV